jgi:hypothetical protein
MPFNTIASKPDTKTCGAKADQLSLDGRDDGGSIVRHDNSPDGHSDGEQTLSASSLNHQPTVPQAADGRTVWVMVCRRWLDRPLCYQPDGIERCGRSLHANPFIASPRVPSMMAGGGRKRLI